MRSFSAVLSRIHPSPPLAVLGILTYISVVSGAPTPETVKEWLHGAFYPEKGATLKEEIHCYNLPYGAIGFVSHILTYYTAGMLIYGRTPLFPRPGEDIKKGALEVGLAILCLAGSVPIAALTMHSCRHRWEFMLIALWKMMLSVTLTMITIHVGVGYEPGPDDADERAWWISLYLIGTILGNVGLLSLVIKIWNTSAKARALTYGFGVVGFLPLAIVLLYGVTLWLPYCMRLDTLYTSLAPDEYKGSSRWFKKKVFWTAIFFGLFTAFYCDWVLATIDENYSGTPSEDIAILYWVYFAVKRLPMLSI